MEPQPQPQPQHRRGMLVPQTKLFLSCFSVLLLLLSACHRSEAGAKTVKRHLYNNNRPHHPIWGFFALRGGEHGNEVDSSSSADCDESAATASKQVESYITQKQQEDEERFFSMKSASNTGLVGHGDDGDDDSDDSESENSDLEDETGLSQQGPDGQNNEKEVSKWGKQKRPNKMNSLKRVTVSNSSSGSGGGGGSGGVIKTRKRNKTVSISSDQSQLNQQRHQVEDEEQALEQALLEAIEGVLFITQPEQTEENLEKSTKTNSPLEHSHMHSLDIEASCRRRLDRRTFYHSLVEKEWSHLHKPASSGEMSITNRRRFLSTETSRKLHHAVSMGMSPKWRRHTSKSSGYLNGIRLYSTMDEQEQAQLGMDYNAQDSQAAPSLHDAQATMSMQETVAMALAHSFQCGLCLLDDVALTNMRLKLAKQFPNVHEDVLKPANLLKQMFRFANEGKLTGGGVALSTRMQRDIQLGLEDPHSVLVKESLALAQTEERGIMDGSESCATVVGGPLPLLVFLRVDASTNLLKSKTVVETLLQECCSNEGGIHTLILGKGIDASTVELPLRERHVNQKEENRLDSQSQNTNQNNIHPFSGMSSFPGFPNMGNASGMNDPEGSKRFNIFLARTVDPDGNPGIMGAIAPPEAGNLFPHMLQQQQAQQGHASPNSMQQQQQQWAQILQQHQSQQFNPNGMQTGLPQLFNASMQQQQQSNGNNMMPNNMPPPHILQQAMQQAMSGIVDRLADGGGLPPHLSDAFKRILENESLRKGIAENLARAAPALIDPRCQGVMLSVYVPPPQDHPNRGMMPSIKSASSSESGTPPKASTDGHSATSSNGGNRNNKNPNQMGNWIHKILNNKDDSNDKPNIEKKSTDEKEEIIELDSDKDKGGDATPAAKKKEENREQRIRAVAAATSLLNNKNATAGVTKNPTPEEKALRHLLRLQSMCQHIPLETPKDPVRARAWQGWIDRERGAVIFRNNRKVLNAELAERGLTLKMDTGTHGAGSVLRQMMSIRDVSEEMPNVIQCAIELEASRVSSQRRLGSPQGGAWTIADVGENDDSSGSSNSGSIDFSLHQLLVVEKDDKDSTSEVDAAACGALEGGADAAAATYLHPSSIESALQLICSVSPSPSGSAAISASAFQSAPHRTRESIMALAQDKHERALVSQVVSPGDIGVTYDMIGGLSSVKELLRQSITYPLKFPHLYSEGIARESVKGVLLFGPPGTGKTMLAKAVATEGGASFLSVDASSVENKWLGESEKNAKAVFTLARRLAPCVIFIDEVDSLLSSREGSSDDSAHGTLTSVKTTMMSEWDGLNSGTNGSGDRVVVIGSTNRPFDLDEAVLRRFPRRILVDLPDLETRQEILEVTMAENRLDPDVNLTTIAEQLEGYTGSDIKEVCREAVVQISHQQARLLDEGLSGSEDAHSMARLRPVTSKDFENALGKLKRSVSEKGRELARVWEWNEEYGEIKKDKRDHMPQLMNMFL